MISDKFVESWLLNPQAMFCLESLCFHELLLCLCHTNIRQEDQWTDCAVPTCSDIQMCYLTVHKYTFGWPQTGSLGCREDRNCEAVASVHNGAWSAWLMLWMLLPPVKATLIHFERGFSALTASNGKIWCKSMPTAVICPGKRSKVFLREKNACFILSFMFERQIIEAASG